MTERKLNLKHKHHAGKPVATGKYTSIWKFDVNSLNSIRKDWFNTRLYENVTADAVILKFGVCGKQLIRSEPPIVFEKPTGCYRKLMLIGMWPITSVLHLHLAFVILAHSHSMTLKIHGSNPTENSAHDDIP
uniref:Uncharacterized protein n=1 Tax=Glossina brevipalpis TaxID=37001 RepID=A0A1A9WMG7_9MUSC